MFMLSFTFFFVDDDDKIEIMMNDDYSSSSNTKEKGNNLNLSHRDRPKACRGKRSTIDKN